MKKIIRISPVLVFFLAFSQRVFPDALPEPDSILVEKGSKTLYLIKGGHRYREYRVALGRNPVGHKTREGDGKTPEGDYLLDWRNPNSRFYKSLHISYPNASDVARAERNGVDPGGMIMIHGRPNDSWKYTGNRFANGRDWTDGCIALTNAEMDELWAALEDGTPIKIEP